jgi:dTDP-4-dehydrorhamnose reductase
MKALITGCNGLLGQKLISEAPNRAELFGVDLHAAGKSSALDGYFPLDLSERAPLAFLISNLKPDCVINAAGYTNVDGAELERELCWRANVTAVENLSFAAHKVKAKLVHLSTDYIFDGRHGPYLEDAVPNPIGFYGRSKLASENLVRMSRVDYAIVRTMVLYGKAEAVRPNFVTWVIEKLQNGEKVRAVNDQFGNTTLADELAASIWKIIEKSATGIFNIAGREIVDRFTFAKKIAQVFDLDSGLVMAITSGELAQAALRPMHSGLIVEKAISELGVELTDVEGGLKKLKKQFQD